MMLTMASMIKFVISVFFSVMCSHAVLLRMHPKLLGRVSTASVTTVHFLQKRTKEPKMRTHLSTRRFGTLSRQNPANSFTQLHVWDCREKRVEFLRCTFRE